MSNNEFENNEDIEILFTEDLELLEDHLSDIILAIGLPEEQTNSILRLIDDALENHHANILDTVEQFLSEEEEDEAAE
ncbi:MAG: hypothetical protein H6Q65_1141 [Firmicutes bacterium]|nr:hypothetical protein [Bacillota bacterium]